jgi:eukaryotic-like serine/threonine-protein kinase
VVGIIAELSKARDVEYGAAFVFALAGDSSRSYALANEFERRSPEDIFVRSTYGPMIRVSFELNHQQTARSIELLQTAAPYDLPFDFGIIKRNLPKAPLPTISLLGCFGSLYPVYVRGEAYLASHQGIEAAAEFQTIL